MPEIPRLSGFCPTQELGHPREYEHPVVAEAINRILTICQQHNVPCGHPHPDARNIERLIASGYRFLMPGAPRSFSVLEQGRKLAGRRLILLARCRPCSWELRRPMSEA